MMQNRRSLHDQSVPDRQSAGRRSTLSVIGIPIMRGSLTFRHIAAMDRPTRKMNAGEVNMKSSPYLDAKKPMLFCDRIIAEVISLKAVQVSQGRTAFPIKIITSVSNFVNDLASLGAPVTSGARRNETPFSHSGAVSGSIAGAAQDRSVPAALYRGTVPAKALQRR